jgi:hypothetical protein
MMLLTPTTSTMKTRSAPTQITIRFDSIKLYSFLPAGLTASVQLQSQS